MPDRPRRLAHLCVDVQNMFAADTDWQTPWLNRMLPAIEALVERDPEATVFTRFVPPSSAERETGAWQHYYERWPAMTGERLAPEMIDLVPALKRFVPPARVFDKNRYSPWLFGDLDRTLRGEGVETILITGGETDVCVLAAILGSIDLGYRTILASDAVFGSANQTHDAALTVLDSRFGEQLIVRSTAELLDHWDELAWS